MIRKIGLHMCGWGERPLPDLLTAARELRYDGVELAPTWLEKSYDLAEMDKMLREYHVSIVPAVCAGGGNYCEPKAMPGAIEMAENICRWIKQRGGQNVIFFPAAGRGGRRTPDEERNVHRAYEAVADAVLSEGCVPLYHNHYRVHLMFFSNQANTYNFYVRNNIFHKAENAAIVLQANQWNGLENLVLDNNIYYQPSDKTLVQWGEKSFLPRDFDTYKELTGKDANSRLVTLKNLLLEPVKVELRVNGAQQIKVNVLYSNDTTADVTKFALYTSSDNTVASIDSAGMIKGLRPGKAVITVAFEGLTATASLRVAR